VNEIRITKFKQNINEIQINIISALAHSTLTFRTQHTHTCTLNARTLTRPRTHTFKLSIEENIYTSIIQGMVYVDHMISIHKSSVRRAVRIRTNRPHKLADTCA